MTARRACHHLLRTTAREMAGALYDEIMKDNARFSVWKQVAADAEHICSPKDLETRFIDLMWPNLIEQARVALAQALTSPNLPESAKSEIHEALVLDNELKFQGQRYRPPHLH